MCVERSRKNDGEIATNPRLIECARCVCVLCRPICSRRQSSTFQCELGTPVEDAQEEGLHGEYVPLFLVREALPVCTWGLWSDKQLRKSLLNPYFPHDKVLSGSGSDVNIRTNFSNNIRRAVLDRSHRSHF